MKRFIINIDDVGSTHGANRAYFELINASAVTSCSVMCICPYYSEFVQLYHEYGKESGLPAGLHITLTSEWRNYRWRPLTGNSSSLCDSSGHFHANNMAFLKEAKEDDIKAEIRAQIEQALEDGLPLTHIDAHMGTAFLPNALDAFLQLADEYEIPPLLIKNHDSFINYFYPAGTEVEKLNQTLSERNIIIDDLVMIERFYPEEYYLNPAEYYYQTYQNLEDGTYFIATHPDTCSEIHHIAPRWVHVRRNEYEMLSKKDFVATLARLGIEFIGWEEALEQK
ncbi:MAG: ChbG/HpnK family deacetylase [Desulfofustis sp.]